MDKCSGSGCAYSQALTLSTGTTCTLTMEDSYGDGWNGNKLTMFGRTFTIESRWFAWYKQETFVVTDGMVTDTVLCDPGNTDELNNISWFLMCTDGTGTGTEKTQIASSGKGTSQSVSIAPGADCTLYMDKYLGSEWIGTQWTGFGQTLTLDNSNSKPSVHWNLYDDSGFTSTGKTIATLLWIKDAIMFIFGEYVSVTGLLGNEITDIVGANVIMY